MSKSSWSLPFGGACIFSKTAGGGRQANASGNQRHGKLRCSTPYLPRAASLRCASRPPPHQRLPGQILVHQPASLCGRTWSSRPQAPGFSLSFPAECHCLLPRQVWRGSQLGRQPHHQLVQVPNSLRSGSFQELQVPGLGPAVAWARLVPERELGLARALLVWSHRSPCLSVKVEGGEGISF